LDTVPADAAIKSSYFECNLWGPFVFTLSRRLSSRWWQQQWSFDVNRRRLLTSGLLVATLAVSAALASGSDPNARFGEADERNNERNNTTDTPLSVDDVRQKPVFDERDNRVGIVKGVFDSDRRGPLAIVEVSGAEEMFAKTVAVALDQFELEPDGRLVVLLDGKDLKALPAFTGQNAARS
jgi:hypothetical protein